MPSQIYAYKAMMLKTASAPFRHLITKDLGVRGGRPEYRRS
jgi:hypothetical protein